MKRILRKIYPPLVICAALAAAVLLVGMYLMRFRGALAWLSSQQTWGATILFVILAASFAPALRGWNWRQLFANFQVSRETAKDRSRNTRLLLRRFFRNWRGAGGIVIILVFAVFALAPGWFVPDEPVTYSWLEFRDMDKGPSRTHPLGLTVEGEDVWTIVVEGARPILRFAFRAAAIAVAAGGVVGALSGYLGGMADRGFTLISEVFLAFPSLFIMLTVLAVTNNNEHRLWLIVIYGASSTAKLVRAEALKLRQYEYVAAARASGCSDLQMVFGHILNNAMPVLLVQATFFAGQAVLLDSYVNFLGVGGAAGWAGAIAESVSAFRSLAVYREPWLVGSAGTCLLLLIGAFNLVGDALSDALEVRL